MGVAQQESSERRFRSMWPVDVLRQQLSLSRIVVRMLPKQTPSDLARTEPFGSFTGGDTVCSHTHHTSRSGQSLLECETLI